MTSQRTRWKFENYSMRNRQRAQLERNIRRAGQRIPRPARSGIGRESWSAYSSANAASLASASPVTRMVSHSFIIRAPSDS
jgi:hypothetical protein